MKYLLIIPSILIFSYSFGQVQIWSDDFDGTAGDWDLTLQPGTNGADANIWVISDEEGGVTPPDCGVAGNGNNTLHVGCQGAFCIGTGAVYNAGDGGAGTIFAETDIRAAYTTPISTVGETGLEFVFDWIGVGDANNDFVEIEYSIDGGATWDVLWTQSPGATCGGGQGEWAEETVPLPVAAEDEADLRFAFHWVNNNDGVGSDPSFAVNNLRLFAAGTPSGPTANFTASSTNICEDDCIDLSDNSTGSNISDWDWTFNGATPVSSTDQNPSNICYSTAGTYDITLTITDDNGTDDVTQSITVSSCASDPPVADFDVDTNIVCKGDCISFTDLSTGDPTSWEWTFEEGSPSSSTSQNPSQICYDSVGTFDVTLTVTNANGSDQSSTSITVLDVPEVDGFGDTIIDIGGAAVLGATYGGFGGDFFWDPSENLDCDDCLEVVATPYLTTTYYPTLIGPNGCPGRDSVLVVVNFEEIVEVPSAFSPNGDGLNDELFVRGIGIVTIDFKIFNRYGQMVYSSTDLEEGWDGTLNGEELNQGVFVYTLEYDLINGQSGEKSGNVTLVK